MGSKTCKFELGAKSVRSVVGGVLTSVLALLAFVMCMPQLVFADEAFQTIDGTMTITLQGGASGGGAGGGTSTVVTTSTTTSGGASSNVLTGDTLIWLILGIVVLLVGAVYVIVKSRRLASMGAPATGTSADSIANAVTGSPAENLTSAKRKTFIIAVVSALVACACFGMFASKSNAFAKDYLEGITGTSNVVVDEQGNVLSNDLAINNNSGVAIYINNIQAPEELNGWNASIKDETVQSGSSAKGTWDGRTIPASVLEQVKSNSNASIELALKVSINKAFDFDKFSVDTEGLAYNGEQIKPEVTSDTYKQGTDYEVIYGENKNVGEGTVTIKGIGDYKGEKTYTFTIVQREVSLAWSGDSFTYNGQPQAPTAIVENLVEGDTVNVAVEGIQTNAGTYTATATGLDNANYKLPAEATHSFTIEQKELTLTWGSETTFTYNGESHLPNAEITGVLQGDTVKITVEGEQTNASDTPYTASAKIDNVNYKLPSANTKEFSIAKAQVKVSGITAKNKAYDGNTKADLDCSKAIFEGKLDKDVLSVSAEGAFKDATIGTDKEVTISNLVLGGDSVGNYELDSAGQQTSTTASITQASLNFDKFSVDAEAKEYAGKQISPEVTSETYKKGSDFEVAYGENKNTGKGTITINGIGNYQGTKTYTFTINQKELTLTWGSETAFTYDGKSHVPTVTVGNLVEGDKVVVTVEGAQTNASDRTYTATAVIDNTNYKLPADSTKSFTIARAEIVVSGITAKGKVYDGTTKVDFDCTKATLAGKVGDDDLTVTAEGAFEYASAGTNKEVTITKLTLGGTSAGNYKLAREGQQTSATATIEQAMLDFTRITIDTKNVTYTGEQIKPAVTSDDYTEYVDYEVVYGKNINAGENAGSVTIKGIGNYTGEDTTTFTIAKANPNPTIPEGLTAETGQTLADVVLPKQTEPVPGTFAWEAEDPSAVSVGEAGTTPTFNAIFTPNDTNNYNTQVVAVPIAVTNAKTAFAVLFADNTLGFYNRVEVPKENESFDGKTVSAVYKNIENANYKPEWLDKAITSATVVDAGVQPKSTANWFALTDTSKLTTVDVSKLETKNTTDMSSMFKGCSALTTVGDISSWNTAQVTNMASMFEGCTTLEQAGDISSWNTANVTNMASMFKDCANLKENCMKWEVTKVGANHTDFDAGAPGIQSPWDEDLDFSKFTVDTGAKTYSAKQITPNVTSTSYTKDTDYEVIYGANLRAGDGTITIKGLNGYKGEKTYTFAIHQKELGLTWDETSFTYDGKSHLPTITLDGIIAGDTVNHIVRGTEGINAGTYSVIAYIDNTNYALPANYKTTFTITKATIGVSGITAKGKTYDGTTKAELDLSNVKFDGKLDADELGITAEGAFRDANVGYVKTVDISITGFTGKSANNYKVDEQSQYASVLALITPRVVELEWSNTEQIYTGHLMMPYASVKNAVLGDTVRVSLATADGEPAIKAGTYGIVATLSDSNYALPEAEVEPFTIKKAPITVKGTISAASKTYDGTAGTQVDLSQIEITGVIGSDEIKIDATGSFEDVNAGENKKVDVSYSVSGKDGGNYEVDTTTSIMSTTATINRLQINTDKIVVSSEGTTYTGSQLTPQVSYEGLVQNKDFAVYYGENINVGEKAGSLVFKGINNYIGQKTLTFDIVKADPEFNIPQNLSAETGSTLAQVSLPKQTTPVKGTFTWCEPSRDVGEEGNHFFKAIFTPEDTKNYNVTESFEIPVEVFEVKTNFAVYFAEDNSLRFYNRDEVPQAGDKLDGQTVTKVYSDIATKNYRQSAAPWHDKSIKKAIVVDYGVQPISTAKWFSLDDQEVLTEVDVSKLDISKVTDMTSMFSHCKNLTTLTGVSNWDTSNVESMSYMFMFCSNLELDCSDWNVDKVGIYDHTQFNDKSPNVVSPWDPKTAFAVYSETDHSLNFYKRVKVPAERSGFDGRIATAVYTGIEENTYEATTVPWAQKVPFITSSKVVDDGIAPVSTAWWFYDCSNLTSANVSKLDTSNVTSMVAMFYFTKVTSLDLSNFDTANVTNMRAMFGDCQNLTAINGLQNWDTGNVTEMAYVFGHCSNLGFVSVSGFDTKNATTMEGMFDTCSSLACLDLSSWDVSSVKDLSGTFQNCNSLTSIGDISGWNTSNVTNMSSTFQNCSNLVADCSDWIIDKVYSRHSSFNENAPDVVSPWDARTAFAVFSYANYDSSLCFYKDKTVPSKGDVYRGKVVTEVYTGIEEDTYTVDTVPWCKYKNIIKEPNEPIRKIEVVDYGIAPASIANWFYDCYYVTSADLSKLDTSRITDMASVFYYCGHLESIDLSAWDTSRLTNISRMFDKCVKLKSVNLFDTSQVRNMSYLFNECEKLEYVNTSNWDTSKVTNMHAVFVSCEALKFLDVSRWNTSRVIDMGEMFACCYKLSADCSGWDVSRVFDHSYFRSSDKVIPPSAWPDA